jgi:hypothetical protein
VAAPAPDIRRTDDPKGWIAALVVAAGLIAPASARAQTPGPSPVPTATPVLDPCGSLISIVNRPTVTTAVCTVRPGHVLIENGYTNTVTAGPGGGASVTSPQSVIRAGTSDPHLEFALTPPAFNRSSIGGTLATGYSDIDLGAKCEIGYNRTAAWGVNAVVTIPTGAHAFSGGNAQYTGNLNWTDSLGPVFSLSGTLGFNAFSGFNTAGAAQSYFAFIPTLEAAASMPGPSSAFLEYAYFSQAGIGLGAKSLIDFGYVRDLGPNVQLDAEYGFSPTLLDGQTQHYVGAGASFMF